MTEPTMSNRELILRLDTQTEALTRIENQVKTTNGRVTGLEMWKAKITGAWFIVSIAGPIITGLVLKSG